MCVQLYLLYAPSPTHPPFYIYPLIQSVNAATYTPSQYTPTHLLISIISTPLIQSVNAATVAEQGGLRECDVIIVDPPRKGLDDEVNHYYTPSHTKSLLYTFSY